MRSDLKPNDQLIMCMNKSQSAGCYPTPTPCINKTEQYPVCSTENNQTSCSNNESISFGPIIVKPRKKPAPTLATGRRSKYEILNPEDDQKRNVRRARNRAAAERVRVSRLNVEQQLLSQIYALEQEQDSIVKNIQTLQHQKLHLETRVFTHEQMCSNMATQNPQITSEVPTTAYVSVNTLPTSSQQYDLKFNEKLPTNDFEDLFSDSFINEQFSQDYQESFITMLINDGLNVFMD